MSEQQNQQAKYTFAVEPLKENWDNFIRLATMHYKETEAYHEFGDAPNADKDRYLHYNEIGYHRLYVARNEAGEYIGHGGVYVTTSMHTQEGVASEDVLYFLPEYRGDGVARDFVDYLEDDLKSIGVTEITMTVKLGNNAGAWAEKRGYKFVAKEYFKRLV